MELSEHRRRLRAAHHALQTATDQLPPELARALADGLASSDALLRDFDDLHTALHVTAHRRAECQDTPPPPNESAP